MAGLTLPACPPSLKPVQHLLKVGAEHEARDPAVAYWCRLAALQSGLKLDKSSKEALAVLLPLMDWLERRKGELAGNEAVTSEVVASAHIENHAMKLFLWADKEDRDSRFNKNVVKAFYTCGILFDVLTVFGELSPEVAHHRKYAKWKAAYIHNCLRSGETPIAGPLATGEDEDDMEQGYQDRFQNPPEIQQPFAPPAAFQPPPAAFQPPPAAYQPPPTAYQPPVPAAPAPAALPYAAMSNLTIQQPNGTGVKLSIEQIARAQKLCKYAISSLDYEDTTSAITNLNKALHLCQTGQELP